MHLKSCSSGNCYTHVNILLSILTVSKVSVFGVFLVRIFPHLNWIRRDLSVFSPNAENTDQNNSKYGHFLRSAYDLKISWQRVEPNHIYQNWESHLQVTVFTPRIYASYLRLVSTPLSPVFFPFQTEKFNWIIHVTWKSNIWKRVLPRTYKYK